MPEIASWSWLESAARPSCDSMFDLCIERPKLRAMNKKSGYGISTSSASVAFEENIAPITKR